MALRYKPHPSKLCDTVQQHEQPRRLDYLRRRNGAPAQGPRRAGARCQSIALPTQYTRPRRRRAAPCARTAAAAVTARWHRRPSLHPRFLLPTCQHLVPGLKYDELFLAGAMANSLAPEAVLGVHGEYTAAGADVITVSPTSWPALLLAQQVCVPVGVPGPLPVPPVPQFFWLFCCCAGQQLLLHRVVPGPHRPS